MNSFRLHPDTLDTWKRNPDLANESDLLDLIHDFEVAYATAVDAIYKLEYLARTIETEDGVFSFPDGDSVDTKKKLEHGKQLNATKTS